MKPIKYVCKHMIYVHVLKHNCPQCGKQLKVRYESKIVNSNSEEAKNYNFSSGGGDYILSGDVDFRVPYFFCLTCQRRLSIDDIMHIEKQSKSVCKAK